MRRIPTLGLAALALGGGLLLASCSSNDGAEVIAPTTAGATLTKDDFVAQANDICTNADTRIVELQSNDTSGDRAALLAEITPVAQQAITDLQGLKPPAADAAQIEAGIAAMQSTLDEAQSDPTAIINPIGISNPELNAYGLSGCFSSGPALVDDGTTVP